MEISKGHPCVFLYLAIIDINNNTLSGKMYKLEDEEKWAKKMDKKRPRLCRTFLNKHLFNENQVLSNLLMLFKMFSF